MPVIRICLLLFSIVAVSIALPKPQRNSNHHGIIGREAATQGELPYHVAIHYSGSHICSGALVTVNEQQVIITAAHCVETGTPNQYTVVAGDLNKVDNSGFEQQRQVSRCQMHPSYDAWTMDNDIAVLTTSTPFDINENVAPIPLPTRQQQTSGQVVVSGWATPTGFTNNLQKYEGQVVDDETCQQAYGGLTVIRPNMMCAGFNGHRSADLYCVSESGGPLRAVDGSYLAGIASWAFRCSTPRYPDISMEVSYYVDWINSSVL